MFPNTTQGLFGEYLQCGICGKRLPNTYNHPLCPACQEIQLLRDVKDFIRDNDVNEYQVANYFRIPVQKVKSWIREGRIEYKIQNPENHSIDEIHCQKCGAPISFGNYCTKCTKAMNNFKRGYGTFDSYGAEKMRFLDKDEKR